MKAHDELINTTADPLGLSNLETIEPDYDGWAQIEAGLQGQQQQKRNWQRTGSWLAVAASLMLVVTFAIRNTETNVGGSSSAARDLAANDLAVNTAPDTTTNNVSALIGLSQNMQDQVKQMREETVSMPAESAIYVAELEDLIAQVDYELSMTPDSVDLWGQRVNLLLDLAQIYQQQWQIDYGRMASL